jgi:hypothetical protein
VQVWSEGGQAAVRALLQLVETLCQPADAVCCSVHSACGTTHFVGVEIVTTWKGMHTLCFVPAAAWADRTVECGGINCSTAEALDQQQCQKSLQLRLVWSGPMMCRAVQCCAVLRCLCNTLRVQRPGDSLRSGVAGVTLLIECSARAASMHRSTCRLLVFGTHTSANVCGCRSPSVFMCYA